MVVHSLFLTILKYSFFLTLVLSFWTVNSFQTGSILASQFFGLQNKVMSCRTIKVRDITCHRSDKGRSIQESDTSIQRVNPENLSQSLTPIVTSFPDSMSSTGEVSKYRAIFKALVSAMFYQMNYLVQVYVPGIAKTFDNTLKGFIDFLMILMGNKSSDSNNNDGPYDAETSIYNVKKADDYYRRRPLVVSQRIFKLVSLTGAFAAKLILDWRTGSLEKNEALRAKEALDITTQLGPTFVKLGQALSIRSDILSPAYATELKKLQDAVPPFDSKIAKDIIRKELGENDLSKLFATISEKPVS